jgi:hypothetical protein
MATILIRRAASVATSAVLLLGGGAFAFTGEAVANTSTAAPTSAFNRGIVCPRGQHAYHAPGGAVSCLPNGEVTPTPVPPPAK